MHFVVETYVLRHKCKIAKTIGKIMVSLSLKELANLTQDAYRELIRELVNAVTQLYLILILILAFMKFKLIITLKAVLMILRYKTGIMFGK